MGTIPASAGIVLTMTNNGTIKVTPAGEWGQKFVYTTLPSGRVARTKDRVYTLALLRNHALPDDVRDAFDALRGTGMDNDQQNALQDFIVQEMFVEPTCVVGDVDPEPGQIHIDQLSDQEIAFIVQKALGDDVEVVVGESAFRDQSGSARTGEDGGDLVDDPEPARGNGSGDAGAVSLRSEPRPAALAGEGAAAPSPRRPRTPVLD